MITDEDVKEAIRRRDERVRWATIVELSRRMKDWLDNGLPFAAPYPPWQAILDRKDAEKVKNIVDARPK